ncbi:hypothetical protein ACFSKQ_15210 [Aureimonas populi]|uniref:Uncharacterized protein n=1 Tax=Aureimonas populi TaxID=1701758 RepID=A0ABW5CS33_9HYPH
MNDIWISANVVLPVTLVAMGLAAVYIHGRYDAASWRAEAQARKSEG